MSVWRFPARSFDLPEQQIEVPQVCSEEEVDDGARQRDDAQQQIGQEVQGHSRGYCVTQSETPGQHDDARACKGHDEIAYHGKNSDDWINPEPDAGQRHTVLIIKKYGQALDLLEPLYEFGLNRLARRGQFKGPSQFDQ
jgi:hypothetical protein